MTNPAPTPANAPTVDQIAAVACPVERARLITLIARNRGTLPGPLARLRVASLLEARWQPDARVDAIAALVGLTQGRVSQLTNPKTARGGTAPCAP